ncbi:hypothetical protein BC835DRAFT_1424338 [Cytidiella melzeri]|nr:hypothetical protein BC835DRAFT_1424338 [Cytidiella melzeri]
MPRVASDFTAEDSLKWERYAEKCKLFHTGKACHPGALPEGYISVYRAIKQKYVPLPDNVPSLCYPRAPTSGPAVSMSDTAFGEWMWMQEQTQAHLLRALQMTQEQARERRPTDQGRSRGPGGFRGGPGGFRGGRGGYRGDRGKKEKGTHHSKNFAERVSPPREPKAKSYDCRKDRRKQQREQRADSQIPVSEAGPSDTYDVDVQEGLSGTFTPLGEDEFTTSYDLIDDSKPMGCA